MADQTYTLLATEVPAVSVSGALIDFASATLATSKTTSAESIASGDTTTMGGRINRNAAKMDALGRYGGGGKLHHITEGLDLRITDNTLTGTIGAGYAMMDSPVGYAANTTKAISAGSAFPGSRVHMWLKIATGASPSIVEGSGTAQPSGAHVYLGSYLRDGNQLISVDHSGVLYKRGCILIRHTADEFAPQDTPPADVAFWTKTRDGIYFWDGVEYHAPETSTRHFRLLLYYLVDQGNFALPTELEIEYSLALAEVEG